MAKNGESNIAEEAKGLAEDFVRTLGLLDLIFGSLALYWVRLWYGDSATTLFPSTGFEFLDVALLACGAAFVGKLALLFVSFGMAVVESLVQKRDIRKFYSGLTQAVDEYRAARDLRSPLGNIDRVELAASLVATADSSQRSALLKIRANSELSYSVALLCFPYAVYAGRRHAPGWITFSLLLCAALFIVLGIAHQFDYLQTLRATLLALPKTPKALEIDQ